VPLFPLVPNIDIERRGQIYPLNERPNGYLVIGAERHDNRADPGRRVVRVQISALGRPFRAEPHPVCQRLTA